MGQGAAPQAQLGNSSKHLLGPLRLPEDDDGYCVAEEAPLEMRYERGNFVVLHS